MTEILDRELQLFTTTDINIIRKLAAMMMMMKFFFLVNNILVDFGVVLCSVHKSYDSSELAANVLKSLVRVF